MCTNINEKPWIVSVLGKLHDADEYILSTTQSFFFLDDNEKRNLQYLPFAVTHASFKCFSLADVESLEISSKIPSILSLFQKLRM